MPVSRWRWRLRAPRRQRAVLEGRHVGWNASGHQLGTVMPGYSFLIGDLIERVGLEDARELWAMSKEGADYVKAAATEAAMPELH